jgi:signal recognition particle receptor subunit beta
VTSLRIGEVAIISYKSKEKEDFIRSICKKIDIKNDSLTFGFFEINDQLALHLYGISVDHNNKSIAWDLISRKTLGFIIIFDWDDKEILDTTKPIIDYFSNNFNAPIIIVANIKNKKDPPIPDKFFEPDGIPLSPNSRFTFSQIDDPESARNILILLVNTLIEKLS